MNLRNKTFTQRLILFILLLTPFSAFINNVNAAVLTNVTVVPTVLTISTATNVTITFTPVTAITNSTVLEYTYSTSFTGGAALVDADIAITGTNISSKICSGFIAGYFKCVLTTAGSVTTTVTTVIGATHKLTTASTSGNYSFSVSANIGGAGTTYDVGAGLAYIGSENQIQVQAVVPPILALDLYNAGTIVLMSGPNMCNLGVLTVNAVNTCTYDVGVGSNSTTGAKLRVYAGGQLTNGSTSLATASGAISAGTEAYGFYISTTGSKFTASGSYGSAYQTVPTVETDYASSTSVSDKAIQAQHLTITHAATMSSTTPTGSYTQTVFYTVYSK